MDRFRPVRLTSCFLIAAVLFSFHLCACEEVMAATTVEHHDGSCAHHEPEGANGHEDHGTVPGDESYCCVKIIAVSDSDRVFGIFHNPSVSRGHDKFLNGSLSEIPELPFRLYEKYEFPPGVLSHGVFLSSQFTHAPPARL